MLGVRFLDVDFMRINSAWSYCIDYMPFLNSQTAPAVALAPNQQGAAISRDISPPRCRNYLLHCARSIGAVDAPPVGGLLDSGKRISKELCRRPFTSAPPGRGDFLVSNFHPGVIPGNLV